MLLQSSPSQWVVVLICCNKQRCGDVSGEQQARCARVIGFRTGDGQEVVVVGVVGLLKWLGTLAREQCITDLQNVHLWPNGP